MGVLGRDHVYIYKVVYFERRESKVGVGGADELDRRSVKLDGRWVVSVKWQKSQRPDKFVGDRTNVDKTINFSRIWYKSYLNKAVSSRSGEFSESSLLLPKHIHEMF